MDRGAAVSHNGAAYYTPYNSRELFKYQMNDDEWMELPLCPQANFGLAIIEIFVTAVGGVKDDKEAVHEVQNGSPTNALASFNGTQWLTKFPPMITA